MFTRMCTALNTVLTFVLFRVILGGGNQEHGVETSSLTERRIRGKGRPRGGYVESGRPRGGYGFAD
jgi:hypothetical protein